MRAFVQYKGISYLGQNIDFSSPSSMAMNAPASQTTTTDSASRRFSLEYNEVTAGITIPLEGGLRASAAALPVKARAAVAPPWTGVYAAFSAGRTWTSADESLAESLNEVVVQSQPTVPTTMTTTLAFNAANSEHGAVGGGVLTFAMGYDGVSSAWLVGVRSEVSLNGSNLRVQGTQTSLTNTTVATTPGVTTSASTPASAVVSNNLASKWTISEMARLGYLVRPDLLVYGLAGWSWGGFEFGAGIPAAASINTGTGSNVIPFTLNGPTWGLGVEKDLGWMRAFLQYKGISYLGKNVDVSPPSSSQQNVVNNLGVLTSATSISFPESLVRLFSADYGELTAGIAIPLH
jgi:opacity protein-like surface antigen